MHQQTSSKQNLQTAWDRVYRKPYWSARVSSKNRLCNYHGAVDSPNQKAPVARLRAKPKGIFDSIQHRIRKQYSCYCPFDAEDSANPIQVLPAFLKAFWLETAMTFSGVWPLRHVSAISVKLKFNEYKKWIYFIFIVEEWTFIKSI